MNNDQNSLISELDLSIVTTDTRLARILSGDNRACALELWLLQTQTHDALENRLLYGRVLPYDFSNGCWCSPAEDRFKLIRNGLSAQCIRLTLYCSSSSLLNLLNVMTSGGTITDASRNAGVSMSEAFEKRFGSVKLQLPLTVRPLMHLPTRDYFRGFTNKVSPTNYSSCDSASISSLLKPDLFLTGNEEDRELASFTINHLNTDTGLDFANIDAWRLGDLELLVLPGLTEQGSSCVNLNTQPNGVSVQIDQPLASGTNRFRVHARFFNDGAIFHATSMMIEANITYPTTVNFCCPTTLGGIRDALVLEIEAQNDQTRTSWLCYQWGSFLIREINQAIRFSGGQALFKSDWLSKALRPSHMDRLEEAQLITRHARGTESVIGGRKDDPWVTVNRHTTSMVKSLIPPRSKGRFFLRYSEGENTGRLELAEWIQHILDIHRDKHIAWFDPYMEDIGIHLLNAYGSGCGTYTVFTGAGRSELMPRWWERVYSWMKRETISENRLDQRIQNLLAACETWKTQYGMVHLRVFGLPQEKLHDRMVLVRDSQMRPIEGFHLSNSLQKANENFPLLITPIPADVLQHVLDYSDELLRSHESPATTQEGGTIKLKILFDSQTQGEKPQRYNPIDVFETLRAGEILDWWLSSSDLAGTDAQTLRNKLNEYGFLSGDKLRNDTFEHLPEKIWQEGLQLPNFNSAWDALSIILSNTMAGDTIYKAPDLSVPPLGDALLAYLESDRPDAIQPPERLTMVDMTTELRKELSDLMRQSSDPQQLFGHDVTEVSWGDYYALKVLWATDPSALLAWIEAGAEEQFKVNRRRQLGLKCAIRFISSEVENLCSRRQLGALLKSTNGLLRWIGYVAFESFVYNDPKELALNGITSILSSDERLDLLGWMTARASHLSLPVRQELIREFQTSMSATLNDVALKKIVDSMRNATGNVYDNPPWILKEVLLPLISTQRLEVDLVTRMWFDELFNLWTKCNTSSIIFRTNTEGEFTDEVANLCVMASTKVQKAILAKVSKAIAVHARTIQRPFSSQINYSLYDQAFQILLWISGYLRAWLKQSSLPSQIEKNLQSVEAVLARRSEREWRRNYATDLLRYRELNTL